MCSSTKHLVKVGQDNSVLQRVSDRQSSQRLGKYTLTLSLLWTRVTASEQAAAEMGIGIVQDFKFFAVNSSNILMASTLDPMWEPEMEHMLAANS